MGHDTESRRLRWELIILGCMYLGYMGFILCRTAIYVASPAMVDDPALGLTKTMFGAILGWGTAGMVTGKLLSGAVADRLGGRKVFLLALSVTTAAAFAFSIAGGFAFYCFLNFTMLLAAAAGWPAMSKLIAAWYEPDRYGKVWGVISTSSRLSSVLSTLLLGALLARAPWPAVFLAAGTMTVAVGAIIFAFLKGGPADAGLPPPEAAPGVPAQAHPLDAAGLGAALLYFARSGRVWLMCVSIMCTTVLMEVIGFLPLYLKETLAISPAQAATASSVFPAGCLAALLAGGWLYDRVSRKGRAPLLGGMLAVSALCLAALFAMGRVPPAPAAAFMATVVVLFVYGLTVAPSYYLPMSVFSIEHGGRHCGVLIGLIDAAGYAAAMLYQFAGGAIIDRPGGWQNMLILLMATAVAAAASTVWFAREDAASHAGY
ncbi:MAG: MFS transporter [Elusimicrobia bacterium]|nr:MFS transporter [Elusimicrobiota bacterium]